MYERYGRRAWALRRQLGSRLDANGLRGHGSGCRRARATLTARGGTQAVHLSRSRGRWGGRWGGRWRRLRRYGRHMNAMLNALMSPTWALRADGGQTIYIYDLCLSSTSFYTACYPFVVPTPLRLVHAGRAASNPFLHRQTRPCVVHASGPL